MLADCKDKGNFTMMGSRTANYHFRYIKNTMIGFFKSHSKSIPFSLAEQNTSKMYRLILVLVVGLSSITHCVPPAKVKVKHRPQFHFSVPKGWMNDPNGLLFYKGEYHLYYQFFPEQPVLGPRHWGHAVSTDLITWKDHGAVLVPDQRGSIMSGSAVIDYTNSAGLKPPNSKNDVIIAMFTHYQAGSDRQSQSIAYSLDKGYTFVKYAKNPVIKNKQNERHFRDPKIIRYGNYWVAAISVGDVIQFFKSDNMKTWIFTSQFGLGIGSHAGVWECPDLFPLSYQGSEMWVLLVSIDGSRIDGGGPNGGSATQYFVGHFDGKKFTTDQKAILWLDWGPDNYAGVAFNGLARDNVVVIGWMNNWLYCAKLPTRADMWTGQMTLPRKLALKRVMVMGKPIPMLVSKPVDQIEGLKRQVVDSIKNVKILAGKNQILKTGENNLLHVKIAFTSSAMTQICFMNEVQEEVCVGHSKTRNVIFLDRSKSGKYDFGDANEDFYTPKMAQRQVAASSSRVIMDIYLDESSIEIFADEGLTCMAGLLFPEKPFTKLEIRQPTLKTKDNVGKVISAEVTSLYSMDEIRKMKKTQPRPTPATNKNHPTTQPRPNTKPVPNTKPAPKARPRRRGHGHSGSGSGEG